MTPEVRTPALKAGPKPEAEFLTDEMNRLVRACILDVVAGLEQLVGEKSVEVASVLLGQHYLGLGSDKTRVAAHLAADEIATEVVDAVPRAFPPVEHRGAS